MISPYENQPKCCCLRGSGLVVGVVALRKRTLGSLCDYKTASNWGSVPASRKMEDCVMVWRCGGQLKLAWGLLVSLEVAVLAFRALRSALLGTPALDLAKHSEELFCVGCTWLA